jgi:predicted benzoate:H+ symporter BenE
MNEVIAAFLTPEVRQWWHELMRATTALPPVVTGAIAIPIVLALAVRSIMALLVTVLIAAAAITVSSLPGQVEHRWLIVQVICLAGLVAVAAAGLHRRSRTLLRRATSELAALASRHAETSEKYEREVHWRQAAGKSGVTWGELLPPADAHSSIRSTQPS